MAKRIKWERAALEWLLVTRAAVGLVCGSCGRKGRLEQTRAPPLPRHPPSARPCSHEAPLPKNKRSKKCSRSAPPPVSCVFDSRECPPPRARRLCCLCLKATFGCCWFCLTCDTGRSRGALTTPTSQADKWHETQMWQGPRGPGSDKSGSGMGSHV